MRTFVIAIGILVVAMVAHDLKRRADCALGFKTACAKIAAYYEEPTQ